MVDVATRKFFFLVSRKERSVLQKRMQTFFLVCGLVALDATPPRHSLLDQDLPRCPNQLEGGDLPRFKIVTPVNGSINRESSVSVSFRIRLGREEQAGVVTNSQVCMTIDNAPVVLYDALGRPKTCSSPASMMGSPLQLTVNPVGNHVLHARLLLLKDPWDSESPGDNCVLGHVDHSVQFTRPEHFYSTRLHIRVRPRRRRFVRSPDHALVHFHLGRKRSRIGQAGPGSSLACGEPTTLPSSAASACSVVVGCLPQEEEPEAVARESCSMHAQRWAAASI